MNHSQEYYIPYLEWEFSNFPIKINQLKFEETNWGFNEEDVIEVWRDEKFRLRGKICGIVADFKKTNEVHFVDKGNIVKGQIITGIDTSGNTVELQGCFLVTIHTSSLQRDKEDYFTEGELTLDSIKIHFSKQSEQKEKLTRFDWFLCNKVDARLLETTFRKASQKKIRVGIDEYDDSIENYIGSSSSKDYAVIKLLDMQFIVAEVPDAILPNQSHGICLEFRDNLENVNDDLLNGIRHFISFLVGNEIHRIGYSYTDGGFLKEAFLDSSNKRIRVSSMPPIKFNLKYQWGDISWLLNQFLPKYLELRKILPLDQALSRYWIARSIPVGANLPVLASALEILAEKFLKTIASYKPEYLPKEDYLQLIEAERKELEAKLSSVEGGNVIMNKILAAFRQGPNEKMNCFFFAAGIKTGKSEKKAIALRNKMAHGSGDYSKEKRAHEDIVYTRVYEVLFNRTMLKLLGYEGYYIDYSIQGCPLKHIDRNAGEN